MQVTTIQDQHGDVDVHRAGCGDLTMRTYRPSAVADAFTFEVDRAQDVAAAYYGPEAGSFYDEAGGDETYGSLDAYLTRCLSSFVFKPCTKGMAR